MLSLVTNLPRSRWFEYICYSKVQSPDLPSYFTYLKKFFRVHMLPGLLSRANYLAQSTQKKYLAQRNISPAKRKNRFHFVSSKQSNLSLVHHVKNNQEVELELNYPEWNRPLRLQLLEDYAFINKKTNAASTKLWGIYSCSLIMMKIPILLHFSLFRDVEWPSIRKELQCT